MLILSNSMTKSASTIIWWYTSQLINRKYESSGDEVLRQLTASGEINGQDNFIEGPISDQTLDQLMQIASAHGPVIAKTHCSLSPYMKELIEERRILATYSYRDPRDVILSAIDHRCRDIENGGHVIFQRFSSVEDSVVLARNLCCWGYPWIQLDQVLPLTYVETVQNPAGQIRKLANHLAVDVDASDIDEILQAESVGKKETPNWNRFNQAKVSRYKDEMTPEQIRLCNAELGGWLTRLGFTVDSDLSDQVRSKHHGRQALEYVKMLATYLPGFNRKAA